jgi:hypothetical protein
MSGSIFEACRAQRESEAARREKIARRVREVAKDLCAIPGPGPGEWQLRCPHCSRSTFISEAEGTVFSRGRSPLCPATSSISQHLRDSLGKG